jgi:radical SAM superfamily enzyme YgiQ (UPF0313 family)
MRTVLVAIDAKYIHQNLAVRSLRANTAFPVELFERTIKDDPRRIAEDLIALHADVIGFSVYLWNVEIVKQVLPILRPQSRAKIVLGGPEVTYDHAPWIASGLADYVVLGEGEVAFDGLLHAIEEGREPDELPNVAFLNRPEPPRLHPIRNLQNLVSPHLGNEDAKDRVTKIHYVEASRGCPYRCSYCLASLEKPLRFFPFERVRDDLLRLIDEGVRTIKFLDRTFNANKRFQDLLDFLIAHARADLSIQFEITGDVLSDELVDYVNAHASKGLFRFEIGVQSTNDETNRLVDRRQDTPRLFRVVRKLQTAGVVDLHLDLIAGLPGETLSRFRQTFDETYALGVKELQLGVLKLLKGTKLRDQASVHGIMYDASPPYRILSSGSLSEQDLQVIHGVEEMLDRLHNKGFFRRTLEEARSKQSSMFDWFSDLHAHFQSMGVDPSRVDLITLFSQTDRWLERRGDTFLRETLKWDYLERFPRKPKLWWSDAFYKTRDAWLAKAVLLRPEWPLESLFRQAVLIETKGNVLLLYYENDHVATLNL